MLRGYRFRLYPTPAQAAAMRQHAGAVRFIYNLCLEQRATWWRQYRRATGDNLNLVTQGRELTDLRAEFDWIAAAPRVSQDQALRDLDKAFSNFFAGRAKYPTPRKRGVHDTFRVKGEEAAIKPLNSRWAAVNVPKIGLVKVRMTRPLPSPAVSVTFALQAGQWFASFTCETEAVALADGRPTVGIDRGVTNALALSTGELFQIPARLAVIEKRRRRAQRVLARRKRGSNRRAVQRAKVVSLHARARRIRTDWQHRVTTDITRRFGVVALEALKTANMTARAHGNGVRQKAGLNRTILNIGWHAIETMLAYKLAATGGRLVFVDPAFTSQTCAECGVIDRENRKSQAVFECVHCGHVAHADINAAINIRRASGPLLGGEGRHLGRPAEPSTLAA